MRNGPLHRSMCILCRPDRLDRGAPSHGSPYAWGAQVRVADLKAKEGVVGRERLQGRWRCSGWSYDPPRGNTSQHFPLSVCLFQQKLITSDGSGSVATSCKSQ